MLPYTNVCIALHTQRFPSVCEKNFTGNLGGIRTHDLLLTSADVLTLLGKHRVYSAIHTSVYGKKKINCLSPDARLLLFSLIKLF